MPKRKRSPRMKKLKVMIAGGGTGGHIYPALAIADAIKERVPGAEFFFVGAKGRMEMKKVPAAGYRIEGLWISGLQRRLTWKNLLFPLKLLISYLKARRLVKRFKPDLVIGVGGYSSGPVLHVASGRGIPTLIQEQNSYAGLTNKWLSKRVDRICVAFEGMDRYFPSEKLVLTGNPVRTDLAPADAEKKKEGKEHFGLRPDSIAVLVLGGSLGARNINESILMHADRIIGEGGELLWQCGERYHAELKKELRDRDGIHLHPFIERMDLAYAAADVVIARAGAITVSEIATIGKAAIFIPSPHVAEDHQTKNAKAFVDQDAALMIPDTEAKDEVPNVLLPLLNDPERREALGTRIREKAFEDPAGRIAELGLNMLESLEKG